EGDEIAIPFLRVKDNLLDPLFLEFEVDAVTSAKDVVACLVDAGHLPYQRSDSAATRFRGTGGDLALRTGRTVQFDVVVQIDCGQHIAVRGQPRRREGRAEQVVEPLCRLM